MSDKDESRWLTERMQQMRERRERSAPAFAKTWRAAKERSSAGPRVSPRLRGLAFASVALVVAASAGYWSFTKVQQSRRMERDYAALEGALLTYWQAPSDALFDSPPSGEPAQP
jgi:hypothetical protein